MTDDSGPLRRLPRDHERLDALDLYSRIIERTGNRMDDPGRIQAAVDRIRDQLQNVTDEESTLHGWRVQTLFEAVVASLGEVRLLKSEDAGDVYFSGQELKPPDFRIVTGDGDQVLVEVKNFFQREPFKPYRMRRSDLLALQRYAQIVDTESLKVAIYWSRWNRWTLTAVDRFKEKPRSNYLFLDLTSAIKADEMGSLGDRSIGTEWPIGLTLYTKPTEGRRLREGTAEVTVERAEYHVAGRVVPTLTEKRIIHWLILYGGWEEELVSEIVDDELMSASFLFSPPEQPPEPQPFALHRPLSSIYSGMFNDATLGEEGEVRDLRIDIDPGALGALIPEEYGGEELGLWVFHVKPS